MIQRSALVFCIAIMACIGQAIAQSNNAYHWPLHTKTLSPAWQFKISPDIAAQLRNAPSVQVEVRNADGKLVPTARLDEKIIDPTNTASLDWLVPKYSGNSPAVGAAGEAGVMSYRYELPAAFPIYAIRVALASLKTKLPVALLAETGGQWKRVGQLSALEDRGLDYAEVVLPAALAAKKWRLQSIGALSPAPVLRFGSVPERFVFLSQGKGPYVLLLNPTRTSISILPTSADKMLAEIRKKTGADWMPPMASLGSRVVGTGEATAMPEAPKSWKKWWPWIVFGAMAILLTGIVLSLRKRRQEKYKH